MAIDFGDMVYTSTDGLFTIPLGQLHINTWVNAFVKAADHVTGNEAISKASTENAKRRGNGTAELTAEERAKIVLDARTRFLADMVAGTWGEKGNRAPRQPGATRLEQIYNNLLADATRKAIAKAGYKAGEAKNTWTTEDGTVFTLADAVAEYLGNEELGATRKADMERAAQRQYDKEVADAEDRKAAKEREAKPVTKGPGLRL